MRTGTMAAAGMALLLALPAVAQRRGDDRRGDRDDGPELGVARISVADGDVRIRTADGDEMQARGGDPLRAGDAVITGNRARAEIELDRGNFARLSSESELRMLDLGNLAYRMQVVSGLAGFSQFEHYEADLDVETEHATVRVIKPAEFAVEVREGAQTDVAVRDGQVDVVTERRTERVKDRLVIIRGEGRDAEVRMAKNEPKSAFDDWGERRDKMLDDGSPRGARIYPPFWNVGLGIGWGYPYYPYYTFGPGFQTVVVSRPIGTLHGGHGHRGRGRR